MRTLMPICCALLLTGCGGEEPTARSEAEPPTSRYKQTLDEAKATADSLQQSLDSNARRSEPQRQ